MVLMPMDQTALRKFALRQTYLAIDSLGSSCVFASLRDMGKELEIDHTTLSKRLKTAPEGAIIISRTTGLCYFVRKVGNNQENLSLNAVHMDQSQQQTPDEHHV